MRTIDAGLLAMLQSETTTIAFCVKVTPVGGTPLGFTNFNRDLTVGGVVYSAATGQTPSNIDSSIAMAVDNLQIQAFLDSASIDEVDVFAGVYDNAEVEVLLVNWDDTTQPALILLKGTWGEYKQRDDLIIVELRSLSQKLQESQGEVYSAGCRADLGKISDGARDNRCSVDLVAGENAKGDVVRPGGYYVTGTATSVDGSEPSRIFFDTTRTEADNDFKYGLLTWTSGNNSGFKMEVKDYLLSTGRFELFLAMPNPIQIGDGYSVHAGCDKRRTTCRDKFQNLLQMRAEPFVPGQDKAFQYPKS